MAFNYLKSFCYLFQKTEVPHRFALWCGVASILAVLERKVRIPQGIFDIFPNFYMVLIAGSGQKKSTPINKVSKLLRQLELPLNIIAQKISTEALISAIKKEVTTIDSKPLAKKIGSCGGIVLAPELTTFLDRGALDRGLGPVLTALFDCEPFDYKTISRGTEQVESGYLSILGGTTFDLLRDALPKSSVGGGFTSRTIFVYDDSNPPPIAWVEFDEQTLEIEDSLVKHLDQLRTLEGVVTLDHDAKEFFINDYNNRHAHSTFRKDAYLGSYEHRRSSHLFKVAIALMLSESRTLNMTLAHIQGAKIILEEAEEYMPRVMDLITASDVGAQGNMLLSFIKSQKGGVTRSALVRHFGSKMDTQEITKAIDTLYQGKRIEISTSATGGLMYVAIDK